MKRLTILCILTLAFSAAVATAMENPPVPNPTPVSRPSGFSLPDQGFSGLETSSQHREIQAILSQIKIQEDKLLHELLVADDDQQIERIIRRIERLDVDRELAILKAKARFARLNGRFDLERKYKGRILDILTSELAMLD